MKLISLIFMLITIFSTVSGQKRSRAESIYLLRSSNTPGFGNIWGRTTFRSYQTSDGTLFIEPYVEGKIGLSGNLSIAAGMVPFEKGVIGKSEIHAKLTLPENDNLRIFGAGVTADLILLTEEDTLSLLQGPDRPSYNPVVGYTLCFDADLIKKYPAMPLKFYLNISNIDKDRDLLRYDQISLRSGLEYKGERHSYYLSGGAGLYREKLTRLGPAKDSYGEMTVYAGTGVRFRPFSHWFLERINFNVSGKGLLYSKLDQLSPDKWGIEFSIEMPVFHRETNAEAVRSLIFLRNRKAIESAGKRGEKSSSSQSGRSLREIISAADKVNREKLGDLLGEKDPLKEREKEIIERRKKIDEEMEEIEELLE
ncbi:MAG: hypothetical protein ACLFQK_01145 [Fibrobacterota bacterium]